VACNYQKLKSALFLSANKQKLGGSLILNGRYGLFFDKGTLNEDEFIVTDYFNGENRQGNFGRFLVIFIGFGNLRDSGFLKFQDLCVI
jgi:hypothetical protein